MNQEKETARAALAVYLPDEAPSEPHEDMTRVVQFIAEETCLGSELTYGTMDVDEYEAMKEQIGENMPTTPEDAQNG